MISAINGILETRDPNCVQISLGGISLKILVPSTTLEDLGELGETVKLHTHLQIRDDEAILYGFSQQEALQLFQMLTTVSGVGPRTALSLLSYMRPETLAATIAAGTVDSFGRGSGVGKKMATRIILELRGKLEKEQLEAISPVGTENNEIVSALIALGYTATEAREAVKSLDPQTDKEPLEERIRLTLKILGEEG